MNAKYELLLRTVRAVYMGDGCGVSVHTVVISRETREEAERVLEAVMRDKENNARTDAIRLYV